MFDDDTFVRGGRIFRFRTEHDDASDPPWEQSDGHGPVREARVNYYTGHVMKKPGERVLHQDRGSAWLYDWQEACRLARKDGWNAEPFDAPNRIERAVQADFDYLRGWCTDQWSYIGVVVELLDGDADVVETQSLWGIESNSGTYLDDVTFELADEILYPRQKAWRTALKDARELRSYQRLASVLAAPLQVGP